MLSTQVFVAVTLSLSLSFLNVRVCITVGVVRSDAWRNFNCCMKCMILGNCCQYLCSCVKRERTDHCMQFLLCLLYEGYQVGCIHSVSLPPLTYAAYLISISSNVRLVAAVDPKLAGVETSGAFLSDSRIARASVVARDVNNQHRAWQITLDLLKDYLPQDDSVPAEMLALVSDIDIYIAIDQNEQVQVDERSC